MRLILSTLLFLTNPFVSQAQHAPKEVADILEVFRFSDLINDEALAYLTQKFAEPEFGMTLLKMKGSIQFLPSDGIYGARVIEELGLIYKGEYQYRTGFMLLHDMYKEAGITNTSLETEAKQAEIYEEWRRRILRHPGYLIELALGEDILDTLAQGAKRKTRYYMSSLGSEADYFDLVPHESSVHESGTKEILVLLNDLDLVPDSLHQKWISDMEANGYYPPFYVLMQLAEEVGEVQTADIRRSLNHDKLKLLVEGGLLSVGAQQAIMQADSILISTEPGGWLPYLENTIKLWAKTNMLLTEGYPVVFNGLRKIDPKLDGFSYAVSQVPTPAGQDTSGEYHEVTITGLGHSATSVIHAYEGTGDVKGEPLRFLFLPEYLRPVGEVLAKAGYDKRLFTAKMWRQIDRETLQVPVYISLLPPGSDNLILKSDAYHELKLWGLD